MEQRERKKVGLKVGVSESVGTVEEEEDAGGVLEADREGKAAAVGVTATLSDTLAAGVGDGVPVATEDAEAVEGAGTPLPPTPGCTRGFVCVREAVREGLAVRELALV